MKIKISNILKYLVIVFCLSFIFTPFYPLQKMIFLIPILFFMLFFIGRVDKSYYLKIKNMLFILLIIFFLDYLLSFSNDSDSYVRFFITHKIYVYIWPVIALFYITRKRKAEEILNIVLFFLVISCIFTIRGNIIYPEASRLLAGSLEYYKNQTNLYKQMYIGGYDFIYANVFLVLPLLNYYRETKYKKIIILLVISVLTIFTGAFTIAIMLLFCSLIFYFIRTKKLKKSLLLLSIILIIIVLLKNPLLMFLSYIGEVIKADIIVRRANEMLNGTYNSTYTGSRNRMTLYYNAILNIINSPILGQILDKENVLLSGHSNLLQFFEFYGLFGFTYIAYLFCFYRKIKKNITSSILRNQFKLYYLLVIIFISVDTINSSYCVGISCFFIGPLLFLLSDFYYRKNKRGEIKNCSNYCL